MGKRITNYDQGRADRAIPDDNLISVMGHGIVWIAKTVIRIPVVVITTPVKIVKVIRGKDD